MTDTTKSQIHAPDQGRIDGCPLETELERRIAADPRWQAGLDWGRPRHGHPEGSVRRHVAAVLRNVDQYHFDSPLRPRLRLIALVHDTFKYAVDTSRTRTGENHHGMIARRFAEAFLPDAAVLDVIELHDEAYNAWRKGSRDRRWGTANERADALLARLGPNVGLYVAFYRCDNATEGKDQTCFEWFRTFAARRGPAAESV